MPTLSEAAQSIPVTLTLNTLQNLKSICDSALYSQPSFHQQCSRPTISNNNFTMNISDLANKSSLSVCSAPSTTNCINRRMEVIRTINNVPSLCLSRESSSKEEITERKQDSRDMESKASTESTIPKANSRKRPTSTSPTETARLYKNHSLNAPYDVSPEQHRQHVLRLRKALNRTQSAELRFSNISEHVLKSLSEFGWAVVDNFLGIDHCRNVNSEIQKLEKRGLFTAGQLVEAKNMDEQHIKDIRSDKTYWFSGSDQRSADASTVRMLINYLDSLVNKFSARLLGHTIYGRSKAMLAIYPGYGSRYVKHVDNPAKDGRRITVIYYCNPGWDQRDGGVLRMYPVSSNTPFDIEPRADRLLFFWSDNRIPHEVMPVYKDRYAITVWYMDRSEREEYFKRSKVSSTGSASTSSTPTSSASTEEPAKNMFFKNPPTGDAGATTKTNEASTSSLEPGPMDPKTSTPSAHEHDKKFAFGLDSMPPITRESTSDDDERQPTPPVPADLTPEYLI